MRRSRCYTEQHSVRILCLEDQDPHRFPRLPKPLTIPIAAARFAGGRGIALDVHTNNSANPLGSVSIMTYSTAQGRLACIARGHKEHRDVATADRGGRDANDVGKYDTPPWGGVVEESLAGPVCWMSLRVYSASNGYSLPACHALRQHTIVEKIHGGLVVKSVTGYSPLKSD